MLGAEYYRSLSREFDALKNRVRSFIRDRHWQTDGEWKESVLRSFLRRQLPRSSEVGRGFVLSSSGQSTQIDILVYDATVPVLFRDGDLVFVTPDAVQAAIEVKTAVNGGDLRSALVKLANNADLVRKNAVSERFFGLFAYEDRTGEDAHVALSALHDAVAGDWGRLVHCVCLGPNRFIRYWNLHPVERTRLHDQWRAYQLDEQAQGYFLHNVIEGIAPPSVAFNEALWYPEQGKETRCIAERAVKQPPSASVGAIDPIALAVQTEIARRQNTRRDLPRWFYRGALELMDRIGAAQIDALARLLDEVRPIKSDRITVLGFMPGDLAWKAFQESVPQPFERLTPFEDAARLFGELKRAGLGLESGGYGIAASPDALVLERQVAELLWTILDDARVGRTAPPEVPA
jgi:hypothetical protein